MAEWNGKKCWPLLICLVLGLWWMGGCASDGSFKMPRIPLGFLSPSPGLSSVYIGHYHHYYLIALPGPDLHEASAIRITRHLRDILQERGQEVTLAQDLWASQETREQNREVFEQFFFDPAGGAGGEIRQMAEKVDANLVVTCRLLEYLEVWEGRRKMLRITVRAAADNLEEDLRYGRYEATVEMPIKDNSYSDVEREAARKILEKIWGRVHPTPTPTATDTPEMSPTPTVTRTPPPTATATDTAIPPTLTPTERALTIPPAEQQQSPGTDIIPFRYDFEGQGEEAPVESTPVSEG
jgi:hypothetical protein